MVLGSHGKKRRNGFQNSEKLKDKSVWFMVHGLQPKRKDEKISSSSTERKQKEPGSWFTAPEKYAEVF